MADQDPARKAPPWGRGAILSVAAAAMVGTAALTALLVNIIERKQEAKNPFFRVVELTDETEDPAIWGKNFPLQYDTYKRTVDQQRTRYGGSEALPADPDRRPTRARSSPSPGSRRTRGCKTMWAGYAFSVDFREEARPRLHARGPDLHRARAGVQAARHLHPLPRLGLRRPTRRPAAATSSRASRTSTRCPTRRRGRAVDHPIACIDCHDPATMALRVTRPGFLEGIKALKASQGVADYDVNTQATRQEMRSFVCGQCHVEYYFKGAEKRLTYPWDKGLKVDAIADYYDEIGFKDWTHAKTGHRAAQGPAPRVRDVEPGDPRALGRRLRRLPHALHARRRAQGQRPPRPQPAAQREQRLPDLPQVAGGGARRAGGGDPGAHRRPAQPRDGRAHGPDRRHRGARRRRERRTRTSPRRGRPSGAAQFFVDFVESENSNGFHAPQEATRILGDAIDLFRKGQVSLRPLKWAVKAAPRPPAN